MTGNAQNISIRGNKMAGRNQILDMPRCRIVQSSTQSIPNATLTRLNWNVTTPITDTDGFFNTSVPTQATVRSAGLYDAKAHVIWGVSGGGAERLAFFLKNGTGNRVGADMRPSSAADLVTCNPVDSIQMSAGDFLELWVYQDSGGALSTSNAVSNSAEILLCLIST